MFHIGFLVGRTCLPRPVEEEFMRRKHAPSEVYKMSMCGHETTHQEYRQMQGRDLKYVNCKKCVVLLK